MVFLLIHHFQQQTPVSYQRRPGSRLLPDLGVEPDAHGELLLRYPPLLVDFQGKSPKIT